MILNSIKVFLSTGIICIIGQFAMFSTTTVTNENANLDKKTKRCTELINEIAKVSGLKSIEIPEVEVVDLLPNTSLGIAMYTNDPKPKISIHEWTYDICMEDLGKDSLNGLAFILAHELAHVTKKHIDRQLYFKEADAIDNADFRATTQEVIKVPSTMDSVIKVYRGITKRYNIRKHEAEADLFAGFSAYLAGYDTKQAGAKFLERAYEDFGLDNSGKLYVSLKDRQEIVKKTGKKLDTLIQVFEMANLLTIAGEYGMATNCYKYINQYYSSPALLNNIGLSMVLEVTENLDNEILPYYLPFSINTSLVKIKDKAPPIANDGDGDSDNIIGDPFWIKGALKKLETALDYFKTIQLNHPNSYEAHLNESIANYLIYISRKQAIATLWSDTEDYLLFAKASALKAKNAIAFGEGSDKALSDVYCMLAILEHYTANQEQAITYYQMAKNVNANNKLLDLNKHIVSTEGSGLGFSFSSSSNTICSSNEKVYGKVSISDFVIDSVGTWDITIDLGPVESGKIFFTSKKFPEGQLYNISNQYYQSEIAYYTLFQPNANYEAKSACGISIGSQEKDLDATYGPKPKVLQSSSGTYYSYNKRPDLIDGATYTNGTIFFIDQKNTIGSWYIFEKME